MMVQEIDWNVIGSTIDRTKYPDLYRICGPNLPDLRGLFLRGYGGNSAELGVVQGDAVGYHSHRVGIRTSGNAG